MGGLIVQLMCVCFCIFYLIFMCGSRLLWFVGIFIYTVSISITAIYFLCDSFTGDGITEAVFFHLIYGFGGVDFKEFGSYIAGAIFFIFLFSISIFLFWKILHRCEGRGSRYKFAEFFLLVGLGCFSVLLHPAVLQSAQIVSDMKASGEVSLGRELVGFDLELNEQTNKQKNLVYIYVESLERTFLKEDIFPGLAPNLSQLERDSLFFEGVGQAPLTDWTIAGTVASQCGMPLATFRFNRNDTSNIGGFMPGATCFGDIMKKSGYYSIFMGGADLTFAGKGNFYNDHGFDEVVGKSELVAANRKELSFSKWGVYDDILLESAYDRFKKISDSNVPFVMFLITLDTHPPIGHKTPSCSNDFYEDGRSGILNAVHCSDRLVSEFVKKIEAYSGENLVVVIASDHLQMRNDITDTLIAHQAQRENLFFVRGAGIAPRKVVRSATTLDIFPTLLYLMGWENVYGAALGRNLLTSSETLVEKYGKENFYSSLQKWRMGLWGVWSKSTSD